MTKKDYILIADALRPLAEDQTRELVFDAVVERLCEAFASDNQAFKPCVFRGYIAGTCGNSGGKIKE